MIDYQPAQRQLEALLKREWKLRSTAPREYGREQENKLDGLQTYYLRKNMPEIFARGTGQVVFSLTSEVVAKFRPYCSTSKHYVHCLGYEDKLIEAPYNLEQLGFSVWEHHYVGVEKKEDSFQVGDFRGRLDFALCPDMRERGRYNVEEVRVPRLRKLQNGEQLVKQYNGWIKLLQQIYKGKRKDMYIFMNRHATTDNPTNAFRHMFLLRTDPKTNKGDIFAADLDHVYVGLR